MRTSLGDQLVALRRPAALAALAAGAGGVVAVLAPRLALWHLMAEVQALDTVGEQSVTTLPGAAATPLSWVAAVVGLVIVLTSLLVALDRPPPRAELLLLVSGAVLLVLAGLILLDVPAPADFVDQPGAADLVGAPVALPTGVGIALTVEVAAGTWLLAAAGLLVLAGTTVAARRG